MRDIAPGNQADSSNMTQSSKPTGSAFNWAIFDSALNKYRNKNVSQKKNRLFAWVLSIPRFVLNWLKVYEPRWRTIMAMILLVAILGTVFLVQASISHAASFTFVQTDWTGGSSVSTAAHPGDQSSWNKFSAQTNADTTGTAGSTKVATYTNNVSETFSTTTNRDGANTTSTTPTPAHVQSKLNANDGSGSSIAATWTSNTTTGNLIVVYVQWNNTTRTISSISDGTNTYTLIDTITDGQNFWKASTYYAKNIIGGTTPTITVTFSGGATNRRILMHEISGLDTTAPLDQHVITDSGLFSSSSTDALTSSSVTTVTNGEYIFGATSDDGYGTTVVSGTGYTSRQNAGAAGDGVASEDKIQSSLGSVAATFTRTGGTNSHHGIAIVTFKPVPAVSTPAFVQAASYANFPGTSSKALAFGSNTYPGDLIAGFVAWDSSTNTLTSVTGCSNTYTIVNNFVSGVGFRTAGFYAKNITGGACTVTLNFASTLNGVYIMMDEIAGADTTSPLDGSSVINFQNSAGTGANAITSTNITTTTNGDYIFGVVFSGDNAVLTAGTGYTQRSVAAGYQGLKSEDKIQSSAGAVAATWTDADGGDGTFAFGIAFKPATATAISIWSGSGQIIGAGNAQSLTLDNTANNIATATLTKTDTVGTGSLTYQLSNNGGSTFTTVTVGSPFTFASGASDLRFKIIVTGNATVQDVSISYTGYNATADLTSSAYNTGDANNLVTKIAWTATGTSGTETVKFQIRTSTDGATWSNWCGASDTGATCTGSNFFTSSDNNVTIGSSNALRSNGNDRWFQYLITLASGGTATPSVNDVTITYVVNAPPQFDVDYPTTAAGGASASQDTNSASGTFGKVLINYRIKDTDSTTGTATPGFITPSFEYNIGGGWVSIGSGNLAATDLNNKAVSESSYTTYTATWNAVGQIPTNYLTTAQVRVTINDNEAANNTAQATSANFTLDTKNPVISSFKMDGSTNKYTLAASDDTNLQYRISNNSDLSADGVNGTSGQWQSAGGNSININPSWTFAGSPATQTVYAQVRDTAGNTSSATAIAPATPHDMDIVDISNFNASSFKLFISWSVYSPVAGAAFSKYEIYRSTDGSSYSLLNNITDVSVNYYADFSLTQGTTYYYKVRVIDTDTDVGNFTTAVSDVPNGTQPGDDSPPVISAVTVASTTVTTATITWTTDELSDSRVDYSIDPAVTFGTGQTNGSVVTSHSVTLNNLQPNTKYNFIVRSTDLFDNRGTNDNGGGGFNFTTGSGPVISGVTQTAVGDHTATIFWTTDKDSDSFVSYSTSPTLTNPTKVGSASLVGGSNPYQHSVGLTNLVSGTTYYYSVESKDVGANNSIANNGGLYYSFLTTTDSIPPVISNISTPVVAPTAAVVVWQTDELATTQLNWGATSGAEDQTTTLDTTLTIFHVVSISSLVEDTQYFFQARSKDGAGNETIAPEDDFTTGHTTVITQVVGGGGGGSNNNPLVILDTTPPKISNLEINNITAFGATVNFTTDEPSTALVQFSTDKTKFTLGTGTAELSKDHSILLKGLTLATDYFVQVIATDKSGNPATSAEIKPFTTLALSANDLNVTDIYQFQQQIEDAIQSALPSLVPPFIEKPAVTNITDTSATMTWTTNIKAYGILDYATDNEYDAAKPNAYAGEISDVTNKDTTHTLQLTNLVPNTVYHYAIKSFYLPDVIGTTKDLTFVTKAAKVSALISKVTNNSFTVSWNTNEPTTSVVDYRDIRSQNTQEQSEPTPVTSHNIVISQLLPGTTYTVDVYGINSKGNRVATAASLNVRTSVDTAAPVIASLKIDTAIVPGPGNRTQTIVSWKTDEPSTSTVYYEEGAATGTTETQKPLANKVEITNSLVLDHAIVLTVLKPGQLYRIQIASTDAAGNLTTLPVKTIVVPTQSESILDIVFKNFEDTFKFLQQIGH